MKTAHGWLMIPLLAACAAGTPQWHKPGAAQAAVDEDLQRCRLEARLAPQPERAGPSAQTSATPLADGGQERDAQEAQLVSKCMQNRGYTVRRS